MGIRSNLSWSSLQGFLTTLATAHIFEINYLRTQKNRKHDFPTTNPRIRVKNHTFRALGFPPRKKIANPGPSGIPPLARRLCPGICPVYAISGRLRLAIGPSSRPAQQQRAQRAQPRFVSARTFAAPARMQYQSQYVNRQAYRAPVRDGRRSIAGGVK